MKEPTSSSSHNNMIDGNWVLKRKRKRVLCRSDLSGIRESVSLESTGKDRSTKPIPSVSRTRKKIKGNDGYYYVCEECNHGGNLLCCDSCPRTYHLDCLKPALKRAPVGKWYCPSCSERKNQGKMGKLADSVSKRARTKVPSGKSMLDLRSSGQMSTSGRNSSSGNYTSAIRGKSAISQTSDYSQGDILRGTKSESGEIDSSDNMDAKSRSTMDEVSKNGVLEGKLTSLFDRSVQKARRKRHKNVKDGVKIKPMLGKDNQTVSSMRKPLAVHCVTSSVMNSEGIPERSSIPGSPRNEDTNAGEKAPGHDPAFQDNQQVDRILGCRVQGCDASWSLAELTKISSKATGSELENNSVDNGGDVAMLDKELCSTTGLLSLVKGVTNVEGQSQNMEVAEPEMKSNCFVVNDLGKSHYLPKESSAVEEEHAEKVLECRDGNSETSTVPKDLTQSSEVTYEFFVKWLGQSNIHNTWIPENQLKVLAKRKLENYKAKYGTSTINICEEQWTQPQRVIGLRELKNGVKEAFVKWRGLPYDECTWERLDEPVVKESSQLIVEFNQFESQALQKAKVNSSKVKSDGQDLSPILEQPKELKGGLLFPHQLEALNWLRKCWHKSKNVILADEMGLGKTVSACAFISSLYHEFKAKLPCLVLVPLSTMPNWLAEFSLWAPHLNVVEYHGCAKARAAIRYHEWHPVDFDGLRLTSCYKFNVLLTTYEMVLADASHLRCISWEVLIVDEGHRLKNSGSKLFSLLNTFSFQHRVLLTGTPLQNNIGEMYNLLNFLQPASFPSLSAFEEKFNDLTTTEKVEELKKLVSPHMLRRLKKDAMQNIPPKTERMAPVELTSIQAEYYRAMLTKNYQILRNIGKGVAQQSMLNIVMQLRKVCNHPYLIPGTEPDSGSVEFLQEMRIKASGKLALLHSMLKILHKEGHRVLIFSQMTKLLDILEDYLTVEYGSKSFERVDGSVSVADRQTAIARFNQDKSRFVFLLSTRSCGLGINLATADTVIIYDSDFNPHADIQAMNRAHRIGQSNRLLVYRLVVRASVEERILQLAKKKLMLDQLFVNKSETQKEVEDILRWGTEELFSEGDQNDVDNPKLEGVVAEVEHKGRRRSGGLGDVYQDKCTDVGNKIVWDENAITKLLDRSNLQASALENADADSENDLLGSVKSTEWNDDLAEEQGGAETNTQAVASDNSVQTFDVKDDNSISYTEENEWDRLLRVRWERYQNEEEESLGRGKRLRKAVSYKESFAQIASEALSESGNEEDEPVPEYTPAGHAFKAKFSRLRARQKERISRRNSGIPETTCSPEPIDKGEETLIPNKQKESSQDQIFPSGHSTEALNISSSKTARMPQIHGNKGLQGDNDQLPVLGLCAPNARTTESISQKLQNFLGLKVPNFEERRTQSEFPMLPDNNLFSEAFNRRMKGIATGGGFSFNLQGKPPPEHKNETVTCSSSGPPFLDRGNLLSSLQESLPKFPLPNFLPNLSLDMIKPENLQDSPSLPPLPLFNSHHLSEKNPRQKPHLPPSPPLLPPPLPENHRKVLDSILMRTGGSGTMAPPLSKKRSKADSWTEDELDSLWIGVRRHGRGNWEALLRDPKLKFSKYRLPEDLSSKWADEQIKILNGPSKSTPSGSEFPPLSDGMMTRALFGSRFAGNFHSHLTDIQLGSGSSEKSMPLMTRQPEKALPRIPVDFGTTLNKSSGELTSGANVLPHWLREAVGLKSTGLPPKKLELPPTVLAVAKSVKVLYERESSIIPPFIIPGQLPSPPKDPNKHMKKKRKMHIKIQQFSDGGATTSLNLNLMSPAASPLPLRGVGMKDEIISEEEGHCEEEEEGGRNRLPLEVRERKWGNVESGGSRLDIGVENVLSAEDVVSKDDENADDL